MTSKYLEQHRRWWAQTLGSELAEARVVMPKEHYAKLVRIATDLEERIPILLGKLIVDYFEAVESGQMEIKPPIPKATRKMPDQSQLEQLCQLLSWSRFLDDTGASRFRQIALVTTLAHEHAQGRKPTASSVGRIIDSTFPRLI
ncbi:hypothetical protein [Rhizobium beringeri]|uniref:hypothetical protein n=1 Tax=Rhizobium beringeri TaxID=3019934 RepID=UPI003B5AC72F